MKLFKCILFCLFSYVTLGAQNFSIGSELGFLSSIKSKYKITEFEKRRNTYYAGLNVGYQINNSLSLTSGIHYLRNGYKHSICGVSSTTAKNELIGKLDYIIMPLLLEIRLGKKKKILTSLGIYGGYNIKAVQDYPYQNYECGPYYFPDISASTPDFTAGTIFGIGYRIFKTETFQLNANIKCYFEHTDNTWHYSYYSALASVNFNYSLGH